MAAVFIPPSPQPMTQNMSTHRPPLANVPNATNSPQRPMVIPAKRSRFANGNNQLEIPFGQPPPKKQALEGNDASPTRAKAAYTSTSNGTGIGADPKLFSRRPNHGQPSAFEKKLVAARDREKPRPAESVDTIRQWQRHYRKAFPQFVFYFDSVPADVTAKFTRQVTALGARGENFFSRVVTHVVTSRPIPQENTSPTEVNAPAENANTVNPSLLEKNADTQVMSLKGDGRRDPSRMDVLHRARQMGMKIWALEKLQRMISTINDGDVGGHAIRNNAGHTKTRGENDLSQVLRNEMVSGPSDRDPLSSMKETVMFKGPFLYIHDMDERTKPVMVREFPKVAKRTDGTWPQFRSAPLGKCPYLLDPPRKEPKKRREEKKHEEKKPVAKSAPKNDTQDTQNTQNTQKQEPEAVQHHEPVEENREEQRQEPEKTVPVKQGSPKKSSESFIAPQVPRAGPFYHGREPAASGVQPSNITSAIRSQMISSTATAPGAKAGVSKEVHELKRKVLEKSNGMSNNEASANPSGSKPSNGQSENSKPQQPQTQKWMGEDEAKAKMAMKRRMEDRKDSQRENCQRRRDPKPGYCENCREKFDDFEEHTQTRKHRKFAMSRTNWAELDHLLFQLERPLKGRTGY